MKPLIALLLFSCCCIGAEPATGPESADDDPPVITVPMVPPIEPPETPAPTDTEESDSSGESPSEDPRSAPRTSEFQNDEIGLVLRVLARQAGVSVYIDNSVTGTVTMRIENKTPLECLEAICAARDLVMEDRKGVLAIRSRIPPPPNMSGDWAAVTICVLVASVGWFVAGILFCLWRSAEKSNPL